MKKDLKKETSHKVEGKKEAIVSPSDIIASKGKDNAPNSLEWLLDDNEDIPPFDAGNFDIDEAKKDESYREFLEKLPFDHLKNEFEGLGVGDAWEVKVKQQTLIENALVALHKIKMKRIEEVKEEQLKKKPLTKEIIKKNIETVNANLNNRPVETVRRILLSKKEELMSMLKDME